MTKKKKQNRSNDGSIGRSPSKTQSQQGEQLKRSIIKTRNDIRKKFRDLHNEKQTINQEVSEVYKPIITPLETIAKREKKELNANDGDNITKVEKTPNKPKTARFRLPDSVFKTAIATHRDNKNLFDISLPSTSSDHDLSGFTPVKESSAGENLEDSLIRKVTNVNSQHLDRTYGLKYKDGQLILGKDPVTTKDTANGVVFQIKRKHFPATPGVTELLTLDHPKSYKEEDVNTYKEMLVHTSAHKKNNQKNGAIIRANSSWKYNNLLSQIFPSKESKQGHGLRLPQTKYKIVKGGRNRTGNNGGINYTYWDDPNELVDRLRLLLSSQSAGHTGHDNEIISIVEELREAKIIN